MKTQWGETCYYCGKQIIYHTIITKGETGQIFVDDDYSDETNHGPDKCEIIPNEYREIVSVSLGVGLQSTIILIMMLNKHPDLEQYWSKEWFVIFSDTGGEQQATYNYLKIILKPYAESFDKEIIVTKRDHGMLIKFILDKKVPMGWVNPLCSSWSKRDNIYDFYRKRFGVYNKSGNKYLSYRNIKIIELIGFTTDEALRVKPASQKWLERTWPLIDMNLERKQLPKIYKKYNIVIPSKSGCWFCPNAGKNAFKDLKRNDLFRFNMLINMEDNAAIKHSAKPPTFINKLKLKNILNQTSLEDWFDMDQMCGESSCMT